MVESIAVPLNASPENWEFFLGRLRGGVDVPMEIGFNVVMIEPDRRYVSLGARLDTMSG